MRRRMTCRRANTARRGSVLLLVIGLLTILAMLGGTFLVISYMNAQSTESLAIRNQADPIARGAVERVRQLMKADLAFAAGAAWPYTDLAGGAGDWYRFADCPSDHIDTWLSYLANEPGTAGRRLSDVYGGEAESVDEVDTDGDGNPDAYLIPAGVFDPDGNEYHIAVNVIDLSGRVNVSTACRNDTVDGALPGYLAPVMVDLPNWSLIGGSIYNSVNAERSGNASASPSSIHNNIAVRPLSPDNNCRPFAIGDETCLRWLASTSSAETGRLYEALTDAVPESTRSLLTTYSASRILVRRPGGPRAGDPGDATDIYRRATLDDFIDGGPTGNGLRNRLFAELVAAGADRDEAGHVVANLWAWLSPYATDRAFAFGYDSDGDGANDRTAYGVIGQPVLAEGYAVHEPETVVGADDWFWGAAVEVYNPSNGTINIGDYTIDGLNIPSIPLDPGERCVLYNTDKGGNATQTDAQIFGVSPDGSWHRINNLNYFSSQMRLERTVAPHVILADKIPSSELDYGASNPVSDPVEAKNAQRDDDYDRQRAGVAKYVRDDGGSHTLGASNDVDTGDIDLGDLYGGFDYAVLHGTPTSLGQLTGVFMAGPNDDDEDLPHALLAYETEPSRGKLFLRGEVGGGAYPDVPWAAVVFEFFRQVEPDAFRLSPATSAAGEVACRQYGKININTAPREVLERLPWKGYLDMNGNGSQDGGEPGVNIDQLIDSILDYRESPGTGDIRSGSGGQPGFLTPAELAVPLGGYVIDNHLAGNEEREATYLPKLNALYTDVANCITTRSDTFAATIRVQIGEEEDPDDVWYYVVMIDRGNCYESAHEPAVLLFTSVR